MVAIQKSTGIIGLPLQEQASDPTAIAGVGQLQVQTDKKAYFFDDAGNQYLLAKATTVSVANAESGTAVVYTLSDLETIGFKVFVLARYEAGDSSAFYEITGCAKRLTGAASTTFVGTPTVTILGEDVAAYDVTVTVNTTTGELEINYDTGVVSTNANWEIVSETTSVLQTT
ncbi:MAG: hypothetical protein OEX12_01230 [Gammaproteobacteria bacterium]|nr:hypothetical protein [Gammaproteobacteria bacterium]